MNIYICIDDDHEGGEEITSVWATQAHADETQSHRVENWPISGLEGESLDADELRLAIPIALEAARHFQHCRQCGEGEKCEDGDRFNEIVTALEGMLAQ